MPDIDVSQKAVATVEAENDKGQWTTVPGGQFVGDKDEVKASAESLMNGWLFKGWPKEKIRVGYSTFRKGRNVHSVEAAKEDLERD